jgi:putative redox protein
MVKAVLEENDHYLTTLTAGNNQLLADEALSNGGGGKGFAPMELLASSLAACTGITLRMYADRKQWITGDIGVSVTIEKEPNDVSRFERTINFTSGLSNEQREKLLDIANHCPVHKLLTRTILVNTHIIS